MGTENTNNPNMGPSKDIAQELDLTHVHSAAKRIFDDLELVPGDDYEETGDMGLLEPPHTIESSPRTRLSELVEEVEVLQSRYEKEGGKVLRRRLDRLREEIIWRREDDNPGRPLNDDSK